MLFVGVRSARIDTDALSNDVIKRIAAELDPILAAHCRRSGRRRKLLSRDQLELYWGVTVDMDEGLSKIDAIRKHMSLLGKRSRFAALSEDAIRKQYDRIKVKLDT